MNQWLVFWFLTVALAVTVLEPWLSSRWTELRNWLSAGWNCSLSLLNWNWTVWVWVLRYDQRSVAHSIWYEALIWGLRPDFYYCLTVAGLLVWGVLSDKRTGLSFALAAGPRQRSQSRVRVPWDSRPYTRITVPFCALEFEFYVTTDDQSASLSWNKAPIWGFRPDIYYSLIITVLFLWGTLSDERRCLSVVYSTGPRQGSPSWVRDPLVSWPVSV
jgi:hypothetical protein